MYYLIYTAYINREGKIVVDGENGIETYPECTTIEEAKARYKIGK